MTTAQSSSEKVEACAALRPQRQSGREERRPIRVLHVIATLDPAGAERQMTQLCRRLDRDQFEPVVCALTRGGPLEEDLARAGVPVHILRKRGRWDLRALARLTRLIRRLNPKIVHTWLPTANTLGRIAAIAAGTKLIIASERAKDAWKGMFRRMLDSALARRTSRIITNAEAVRRFLVEVFGLPGKKVCVVRNGLDLDEFDALSRRPPNGELPQVAGGPVIGCVARLEPQKGLPYLLEAFASLPEDLRGAQLWLVGGGPDEKDLRRRCEQLGVSDRVQFLGVRSDVPSLMRHFDLVVLPSLWEGLPNVVLEAMAARRAVVATNVDGTPEAVLENETAILVPPADPAALCSAIATLLRDAQRRAMMGEVGRRVVAERFGMARMVRETEAIYHQVLAEADA